VQAIDSEGKQLEEDWLVSKICVAFAPPLGRQARLGALLSLVHKSWVG
jgi:hypothetical protein